MFKAQITQQDFSELDVNKAVSLLLKLEKFQKLMKNRNIMEEFKASLHIRPHLKASLNLIDLTKKINKI